MNNIRVLCLGDVVGSTGRMALSERLFSLKQELAIDLTIVNCENACGGSGLDARGTFEFRDLGIDCITLGDHSWSKREIVSVFEQKPNWLIRPLNYPQGAPGQGYTVINKFHRPIVVVNLLGRVFMDGLWDCPFKTANSLIADLQNLNAIFIFDVHAEATSEKIALGYDLDSKASLIFGTHTHVQTADERVSEGGTAYVSDLGMCGALDGVIGMDKTVALYRFKTGMPKFYEAAKGTAALHGIVCEIDLDSGKAVSIKRVRGVVA